MNQVATIIWQVQINGWPSDLEHLERHFTSGHQRIIKDQISGGFVYESDAFISLDDHNKVLSIAKAELHILSGVLKFTRSSAKPLSTGAVYRLHGDGRRDAFVILHDSIGIHVEVGEPAITILDADGNVVVVQQPVSIPQSVLLSQLALSDPEVAKAMRLFASPTHTTWVDMYRIYEVIEASVGGQHKLERSKWCDKNAIRLFKQTANSVSATGDDSRHGKEHTDPPKIPMSRNEGMAFLNYILQSWLSSKLKLRDGG